MISINLLPEQMRKKESVWPAFSNLPIRKTLILGFSLLMGLQILAMLFVVVQRLELAHVKQEALVIKEKNRELFARKAEWAQMQKRDQVLKALMHRKFYWTLVLDALTQSMTKGVWLKGLSLTEDKRSLKLEGSVLAQGQETATVGKFIKELKEQPQLSALLGELQLSSMNQRKINERDVYDFVLAGFFKEDKT